MNLKDRILTFSKSITKRNKEGLFWILEHGEENLSSYKVKGFKSWYENHKPFFFKELSNIKRYFEDNPHSCLLFKVCPQYIYVYWASQVEKLDPFDWSSRWDPKRTRAYEDLETYERILRSRFSNQLKELSFFKELSKAQIEPFLRTRECHSLMTSCADLQVGLDQLKEDL